MRIGIVAGEKSGDYLGSELIIALKKHYPTAEFVGLAGPLMIEQGAISLDKMDKISIMGFDGLLSSLKEILGIRKKLYTYFRDNPPDIFVGIDVPDFNLTLELKLKKLDIPVVHYVSPTVWAWRGGRIKKIRKAIDLMLTLFPFETKYYNKKDIPVHYVGHPLATEIGAHKVEPEFRELYAQSNQKLIAILPGSRMSEVSRLSEVMLQGAAQLKIKYPELRFVIPAANAKLFDYLKKKLDAEKGLNAENGDIQIILGQSRKVLAHCDLTVLASGTAALEAALFAKPMVVMYRLSWLTLMMLKRTRTVDHFSMPNHLTHKPIVPELLQGDATVENLVKEVSKLLDDEELFVRTKKELGSILPKLTADTGELASQAIIKLLNERNKHNAEEKQSQC